MKIISDEEVRILNRRISEYNYNNTSKELSKAARTDIITTYEAGLATMIVLAQLYEVNVKQIERIINSQR